MICERVRRSMMLADDAESASIRSGVLLTNTVIIRSITTGTNHRINTERVSILIGSIRRYVINTIVVFTDYILTTIMR